MNNSHSFAGTIFAAIVAILVTLGITGSAYKGCVNASEREGAYTERVQVRARGWISENPSLAVNPQTLVCTPRSFGYRWPDDFHSCDGLSSVLVPGRGAIPMHLLCNIQGCVLHPTANGN